MAPLIAPRVYNTSYKTKSFNMGREKPGGQLQG